MMRMHYDAIDALEKRARGTRSGAPAFGGGTRIRRRDLPASVQGCQAAA
jgi:hypothetical protein